MAAHHTCSCASLVRPADAYYLYSLSRTTVLRANHRSDAFGTFFNHQDLSLTAPVTSNMNLTGFPT